MAQGTRVVARKGESGIALLIAVLITLLVSALGIAAINHSGAEMSSTGRTRTGIATFHAADGGLGIVERQLSETPLVVAPFNVTFNGGYAVRSGAKSDATPQEIDSAGAGKPPDGYSINVGSGYVSSLFRTEVTATGPGGSSIELEVKLSRFESGSGGY